MHIYKYLMRCKKGKSPKISSCLCWKLPKTLINKLFVCFQIIFYTFFVYVGYMLILDEGQCQWHVLCILTRNLISTYVILYRFCTEANKFFYIFLRNTANVTMTTVFVKKNLTFDPGQISLWYFASKKKLKLSCCPCDRST